ncbi:MAG: T9SS type A sorting domain-containing protein [Melioribacteraceae bacterium]|nr:T9SS type A sorting domain-containing protein [Melioribacteraceae bacterium]
MKRMLVFSALVITLLLSSSNVFAQLTSNGDTLIVGPMNSQNQPIGALNEAIKGDVTDTGARKHSVYKLMRNATYLLTEVIQADFPLEIVADKPDDNNRPPVIRCGIKEDGSSVNLWWVIFEDATFKNIWLSGVNMDGNGGINWISQEVNASGKTISYKGCIIEFPYTSWAMFADWGSNNVYKTEDCVFMNIGNPTGTTWNGAIFHGVPADSIIHRNTTFFNFGCFVANGSVFYQELDHCTIVNSVVHPVNGHNNVQMVYTDNLFINCHAFSDDDAEIKRHYDQEVKGLMNYAEIQWDPQALDSLHGPGGVYHDYDPNGDGTLTEDELVWELKNNNWHYAQVIKDYWAAFPNVADNPWMNNYNKAMFENQSGEWTWDLWTYTRDTNDVVIDSALVTETHNPFQYFVEENTMNLDPGFANIKGTDVLLAQNCTNIRKDAVGEAFDPVKWHNVDDYLEFPWPLDFDLSYTNGSLMTAGTDGFPLGDLNWFPSKKAEWLLTDVEEINAGELLPSEYSLRQNYPNPFNPTTNIEFSIPQTGMVSLKIYNTIGQEVAVLANEEMTAGSYKVNFNAASLSSGIYFYTLTSGEFTSTQKMMLLK